MKSRKMKNRKTIILCFVIRLILSLTFVYASYHKIADPAGFAKILYGYAIFPDFSINILAITIPFIELTAGFCLFFKVLPLSALLLINGLLSGFILLIGFNLLRGHQFDCGCFAFSAEKQMVSNIYLLIRDVLMLFAGIYLWQKTIAS
ncbi:MAG: MauE/DoxX family redox-associated membrane protein [Candidatus Thorarchaeota archaeon]